MSLTVTNDIEKMKHLMGLDKVNESSSQKNNTPILEYREVGADGHEYAIVRECNKHYIMVAPKKDTEILAEDFDYVGGFCNRKAYDSFTVASNQFGLKMKSLNEAYAVPSERLAATRPSAEWNIEETKTMRSELDRMNLLTENVDRILEGKEVRKGEGFGPVGDKAPFDEKAASFSEELAPEKANASRSTEWTNDDEKAEFKEEFKGEATADGAQKSTGFEEKADLKKTDIKEGRTIKLTEAQVLAWSKSKDYMDKSHGTEIGDTAPYDEKPCACSDKECESGVVCEEKEDWGSAGLPKAAGIGEVGKEEEKPFEKELPAETKLNEENELDEPFEVEHGFGDDEYATKPFPGSDDDFDAYINKQLADGNDPSVNFGEEDALVGDAASEELGEEEPLAGMESVNEELPVSGPDEEVAAEIRESVKARIKSLIKEAILDDFGKHPAYRKEPFTLPDTHEPAKKEWAKRWDSESNLNNEEFGKEIGHGGDPYTEKVVDMLTKQVIERLGKK